MKMLGNRRVGTCLSWIRVFPLLVAGLAGLFWISSYFVGIQRYRSDWSRAGAEISEEASWLVSNHGALGFAWRSQEGPAAVSLPPDESELKVFDASPSALSNVHPEGSSSWHWIHHAPAEPVMMGAMRTAYGHLFVPYWMPILASGLAAFLVSLCAKQTGASSTMTVKKTADCRASLGFLAAFSFAAFFSCNPQSSVESASGAGSDDTPDPAQFIQLHGEVTFTLDDGETLHREAPDTFWIPPKQQRENLVKDDLVKLVFILTDGKQTQRERMWVLVKDGDRSGYTGVLDNEPYSTDQVKAGLKVSFEPRHVIDIYDVESPETENAEGEGPDAGESPE